MKERKVAKIERKKSLYLIHIDNEVVSLNETFFLDEHLYVSKLLKDEDIKRLKHLSELSLPYDYACYLLSRNLYSAFTLKEKIKTKYPLFKDTDELISILKASSLIDDKEYALNYKEAKEAALIGPNKIKNDLLYIKRIDSDIVSSLTFSSEEEAIKELLPTLERRYSSCSNKAKQRKIEAALLNRGFSKDLSHRYSKTVKEDEKEEKALLKKDYDKAKRIHSRKYAGYELKKRIIRSLLYKGYKMNDIEELFENEQAN